MDKLGAIRSFIAIANEGSLTKASKLLGKALPTVVRSLALLEEDLGVQLFKRSTRRLSLTAEGQRYLETCRLINSELQNIESELSDSQIQLKGRIRITAPVLFGQKFLAPCLARFAKQNPQVHLEVVLVDRVVNLVEEGFDLALRIANLEDSSLIATRLGELNRVVVGTPSLVRRYKPNHPSDFSRLPCVEFTGKSFESSHWKFQEEQKIIRVPLNSVFSTNSAALAISACQGGVGFGQFLSYQSAEAIADGSLITVLDAHALPPISVSMVYGHSRFISARSRALVEFLKRQSLLNFH